MTNPPYAPQPSPAQPSPSGYPPGPGAYPMPPRPGAAGHAPRNRNLVGIFAVVLVAAALVVQLIASVASATMISSADLSFELYGTLMAGFALVQGALAIVAIVLGALGLAARGRPKALAGIGLGGGSVIAFSIVASQVTNLLLTAFSG